MILGLTLLIIILYISSSVRCSKLELENLELKSGKDDLIEMVHKENEILHKHVVQMEEELEKYRNKVDSLERLKQKVIIKTEYIISENITEGVTQLKENLKCEKR